MNKEDKELLLKDLCGRLPYGVKVECIWKEKLTDVDGYEGALTTTTIELIQNDEVICKPYLRPMSSMTDEEYREWRFLYLPIPHENEATETQRRIDWLNEYHFDYRDLIKKGLALEAPDDMYKTE